MQHEAGGKCIGKEKNFTRMKRLVQINVTATGGSTGMMVEHLAQTAEKRGWETWTLFGRGEAGRTHCVRIGNRCQQMVHSVLSRLWDHHGEYSRHATSAALQAVRELHPSLVHLHVLHGYYLNLPALFEFLAEERVPIVWTLHDCWPFTGRCTHFDYLGCGRWRDGCGHCPSHGVYPKSLFDATHGSWMVKKGIFTSGRLGRMVLVPVSRWMERQVAESFMGAVERRVILNGVDTEVFSPQAENPGWNMPELTGKRILLGVSMYWNDRKGLADYCKLDAMLPEDCRIALVGLEKPIPGTRIIPFPHIDNPRHLAWLYRNASLTLNLSYEESFGLTTAESLACGTPVISYDRTASPELLDTSVGQVCPAGDVATLSQTIASLLKHPPESDLCRDYAQRHFSLHRQMDEYLNLYEELTQS